MEVETSTWTSNSKRGLHAKRKGTVVGAVAMQMRCGAARSGSTGYTANARDAIKDKVFASEFAPPEW